MPPTSAGRLPRVASCRDGSDHRVDLVEVDLDQAGPDAVAGEPAVRDVAAQRPRGHVRLRSCLGEAHECQRHPKTPCRHVSPSARRNTLIVNGMCGWVGVVGSGSWTSRRGLEAVGLRDRPVEACRAVGITRKTGYRWRAENGGVPPVRLAETARSNRYLSLLERQRIATLRANGIGVREIARRIGRAASTVSRELGRNLMREHAHDQTPGWTSCLDPVPRSGSNSVVGNNLQKQAPMFSA
jgi:Helix-turn-helix domain